MALPEANSRNFRCPWPNPQQDFSRKMATGSNSPSKHGVWKCEKHLEPWDWTFNSKNHQPYSIMIIGWIISFSHSPENNGFVWPFGDDYPLVMSNIAIENGPVEIVDEPSIAWWFSIVFPMSTISIVSQLHFSMQLCLSWYPAGSHRSPPSKILSVRGSSTWHVPSGKHTENDGKST